MPKRMIFRTVVFLAVFAISSFLVAAQSSSVSAKSEEFKKSCMSYLVNEGYRPELISNGNILFKSEGEVYLIIFSKKSDFLQITTTLFKYSDGREEVKYLPHILASANVSNRDTKMCKIYTMPYPEDKETLVVASIEVDCNSPNVFRESFTSYLGYIKAGVETFEQEMKKRTLK